MTNNITTNNYINYSRKSSEGKERQVLSIPDQINWAKDISSKSKLNVVDFLEEEKSAETPYRRPIFDKLVERIKKGNAQGIITWKLDRLARNPEEAGVIIGMLKRGEIKHIITNEREYRPEDNAIISYVDFGMADQYVRDLSKNVKRGLKSKLDKGWMPSSAPLGYLNTKIEIRGENYIVKDPERFDLIRKAWDLMLTGTYLPTQILDKLNNEWGFRTRKTKRKGGKPMSRSTIYRIFTNAFYAGLIPYNNLFLQGKHDQMITLEEFDRVQLRLGREGKPRPNRHEYAYTGQIICGECFGIISATFKEKLLQKTGKLQGYILYYCTCARRDDKKCVQKHYTNVEKIDEIIEQEIESLTILPEFKDWALEILAEKNDEEISDRTKIYESQQKAINDTQKQIDGLTQLRIRELIDDEEYLRERTRLKNEITTLRAKVSDTEKRTDNWLELTEQTFEFACYAHKAFLFGDAQTKREILSTISCLNCTLKDHIINIKAVEWLVPIKEKYPAIQKRYDAFEPEKRQTVQGRKEVFASLGPEM